MNLNSATHSEHEDEVCANQEIICTKISQITSLEPFPPNNDLEPFPPNNEKYEDEKLRAEQQSPDKEKSHHKDVSLHFENNEVFNSRNDLLEWCRNVGRKIKVVVVIAKSDLTTPLRMGRLILGCERGGKYRINNNSKPLSDKDHRKAATKKCGCPFVLKGIPLPKDKWKLEVVCGVHNHELTTKLIGHSYAGRLNNEEIDLVKHMSKSGVCPRNILHTLKEKNANNMSTKKTVYNVRNRLRLLDMQGMSCIQYTMKLVKDHHYPYFILEDEVSNSITSLFWCHPESIQLLKCFPHVLIVDCTYKTNKYRMPLLEIAGVASTGQTFNVAFVFMEQEKEDNYVWALERLDALIDQNRQPTVFVTDREQALINGIGKIFPNADRLLCKWHVSKNLASNYKKDFETKDEWSSFIQDWENLVDLDTEDKFNKGLTEFESVWRAHPQCLSYIRTNWLPVKEYFVTAWTKRVIHFGCTTTQRVESAHATLKDHIKSSTSSFPLVWKAMHTMVNLQLWDLDASFQHSILRQKHEHSADGAFKELRGCISSHAMDIILKEKKRGLQIIGMDIVLCGCIKRSTYGLPCAHEIINYGREGRPIPLSCIHEHWKQLSRCPTTAPCTGIEISDDIKLLQTVWDEGNEEEKKTLKRKIKEIVSPCTTLLCEPTKKQSGKGRPRLQKSNKKKKKSASSTKRDPSGFEYAKTQEDMSLSQASVCKPKKLLSKRAQHNTDMIYLHNIPTYIHPLIRKLTNVPGDGHCGFHACAIGLQMSKNDGWNQVRKDLLQELHLHRDFYKIIWGDSEIEKQEKRIQYSGTTASSSHWMEMPSHGLLAANWYNRVIYLVGKRECTTFLPFFTAPDSKFEKKMFGLVYIEEERHYIHVEFNQNAPLPPPTPEWRHHRSPKAEAWIAPLRERMEMWTMIRPLIESVFVDLTLR